MKLTQTQLDQIKSFISKRGFTAIDLQLEIIDHVACRIEDKLRENPDLPFEQALKQTHAEFGVFGFSILEDALIQSLNRKYRRQIGLELKAWLSLPRIALVAGLAIACFQLFFIVPPTTFIIALSICYMAVAIGIVIYHSWIRRRYRRILAMQATNSFVFFPGFILQIELLYEESVTASWIWACAYTLLAVIFAFFFSATLRVVDAAVARCRELESIRLPEMHH
ncbi:hypothetical protein SAMN05421747_1318 [Parapedobacter composti]|uniref:Uncharacterized protein n=1 Tax=Parapedobacter composti TaxID=623281 RepID=A0A1I1MB03_9SPHI|nr:hypothetical protein [Parapedobacter composti]SFC82032.1 hypothetical protein SAMN05421747_1318 [Parapedobacter composti]